MPRDIISCLPEDIIQLISSYSDIADVLALKQTCRGLNRLTDSDYLWHQLLPREELPLDLPPSVNLRSLSALDLHTSALRALKLRYNWARRSPQVRDVHVANLSTKSHDGILDDLILLNSGSILLGVHRDRHSQRPSMIISVYDLRNVEESRLVAHLSVPVTLKDFDACLQADGSTLILATTVNKKDHAEVLEVYSIPLPLDSPTLCNTTYQLAYSFELQNGCLFHRVSLHGDYLASSVLNQPFHVTGHSSQVLIANWKTRQQITIIPRSVDSIWLDIKVLPPYLCAVSASTEAVHVTLVPVSVIAYGSLLEQPYQSIKKQQNLPEFPHAAVQIMDFYDICISSNVGIGPFVRPTSISLIVFPTLSRLDVRQSKKALLLRFAISRRTFGAQAKPESVPSSTVTEDLLTSSIQLEKSIPFDIPVGSYPEYPTLGTTGRRGVWLEQSLKSDYVQVLRFDYDSNTSRPPSLSVLLPPEPQLPFKPSSCRALAYDEATGRLCVGLYNGLLYILDYV